MILDGHTHIHPRADGWGAEHDASVETLVGMLGDGGVQRAVVLPIAPEVSNEFIAEACGRHPTRLIGFASVEPLGPFAVRDFEYAIQELGLKGLKLHPRRQRFGRADFEKLLPLIAKAADLGRPVLMDGFPYGREQFDTREVELVNALATALPHARIILAHAGGCDVLRALLVAKANPNVFVDLSFTLQYYEGSSVENDLAFLVRRLRGERTIFGSDHPYVTVARAYDEAAKFLDRCGMNESQLAAIFGGTMASLL